MKTKIIEAQEPTHSWWGKFLVGQFENEWNRLSDMFQGEKIQSNTPLLSLLGWSKRHIVVVDLSIGHGTILYPNPNASPVHDLEKRGIYFCPLMVPFLEWFYEEAWDKELEDLPDLVQVRTPKVGWLGPGYTGLPPFRQQ